MKVGIGFNNAVNNSGFPVPGPPVRMKNLLVGFDNGILIKGTPSLSSTLQGCLRFFVFRADVS